MFGNLTELPQLSCLYLRGNPVTDTTKQYRRTVICTFPRLTYLDERPIFEGERRCAEAWCAIRRHYFVNLSKGDNDHDTLVDI